MSQTTVTPHITSLEELAASAKGEIVELPAFSASTHFYARLRRPSLMGLVKQGKIPNQLLTSANSLFIKGAGGLDTVDSNMLDNLFKVTDILCEESFVEPTYEQIKGAGIQLTDEQMLFIFSYAQNGVKELDSFR